MTLKCKLYRGGSSVVEVNESSPLLAAKRAGQRWFGKQAIRNARRSKETRYFWAYELMGAHALATGIEVCVEKTAERVEERQLRVEDVEEYGEGVSNE